MVFLPIKHCKRAVIALIKLTLDKQLNGLVAPGWKEFEMEGGIDGWHEVKGRQVVNTVSW